MTPQYKKAFIHAKFLHKGQTRKFNNEPYIIHPVRVANLVKRYTDDADLIDAALLHDTLEDCNITVDELTKQYSIYTASLIAELTNDPVEIEQLGKTKYLINKMNNMSMPARLIKLQDRHDNVNNLHNADVEWATKYAKQTIEILNNIPQDFFSSIYIIKQKCLDFLNPSSMDEIKQYINQKRVITETDLFTFIELLFKSSHPEQSRTVIGYLLHTLNYPSHNLDKLIDTLTKEYNDKRNMERS